MDLLRLFGAGWRLRCKRLCASGNRTLTKTISADVLGIYEIIGIHLSLDVDQGCNQRVDDVNRALL